MKSFHQNPTIIDKSNKIPRNPMKNLDLFKPMKMHTEHYMKSCNLMNSANMLTWFASQFCWILYNLILYRNLVNFNKFSEILLHPFLHFNEISWNDVNSNDLKLNSEKNREIQSNHTNLCKFNKIRWNFFYFNKIVEFRWNNKKKYCKIPLN